MTSDLTSPSVRPDRNDGSEFPTVGFIGLGSQGGAIARRIVQAGVPMSIWARRAATLAQFEDTGAPVASDPADLARRCRIVCVCVLDDAGVEAVVLGPDGVLAGLPAGGVLVIHSTVHPDLCERIDRIARSGGVSVLDAPVSGGPQAAQEGRLLVMVGGPQETLERCRPVFETFADPVLHLGPVGAGQRAKLLNNLLLTAHLGVAESAFALARQLDVDPAGLSALLAHGSGRSYGASLLRGPDFDLGPHALRAGPLLRKDVRLLVDLARSAGAQPGTVLQAADRALAAMRLPR